MSRSVEVSGKGKEVLLPATLDVENSSSPNYLLGFPDWSQTISEDSITSHFIFRRFNYSAVRNLLYLEGRVAALRNAQKKLDEADNEIAIKNLRRDAGNDFDPFWRCYSQAAISWESFAASSLPAMAKGLDVSQTAAKLGVPRWLLVTWSITGTKTSSTTC